MEVLEEMAMEAVMPVRLLETWSCYSDAFGRFLDTIFCRTVGTHQRLVLFASAGLIAFILVSSLGTLMGISNSCMVG